MVRRNPLWNRDISDLEDEFDIWKRQKRDEMRGLGFKTDMFEEKVMKRKRDFNPFKMVISLITFVILAFLAFLMFFMVISIPDNSTEEFEKTVQQYEEKVQPTEEIEPKIDEGNAL